MHSGVCRCVQVRAGALRCVHVCADMCRCVLVSWCQAQEYRHLSKSYPRFLLPDMYCGRSVHALGPPAQEAEETFPSLWPPTTLSRPSWGSGPGPRQDVPTLPPGGRCPTQPDKAHPGGSSTPMGPEGPGCGLRSGPCPEPSLWGHLPSHRLGWAQHPSSSLPLLCFTLPWDCHPEAVGKNLENKEAGASGTWARSTRPSA